GRHERHRHLSDLQLLPILRVLGPMGRYGPKPCLHHGECLGRGEDMLMPRPSVVRMPMGDDGAFGAGVRVDMETTGPAIEALGVHGEPRVETFGSHFSCGEQSTYLLPGLEVHTVARHEVAKPCMELLQKTKHSRYDVAAKRSPCGGVTKGLSGL